MPSIKTFRLVKVEIEKIEEDSEKKRALQFFKSLVLTIILHLLAKMLWGKCQRRRNSKELPQEEPQEETQENQTTESADSEEEDFTDFDLSHQTKENEGKEENKHSQRMMMMRSTKLNQRVRSNPTRQRTKESIPRDTDTLITSKRIVDT